MCRRCANVSNMLPVLLCNCNSPPRQSSHVHEISKQCVSQRNCDLSEGYKSGKNQASIHSAWSLDLPSRSQMTRLRVQNNTTLFLPAPSVLVDTKKTSQHFYLNHDSSLILTAAALHNNQHDFNYCQGIFFSVSHKQASLSACSLKISPWYSI